MRWPTPKGSPSHYGRPRKNDWGDLQASVLSSQESEDSTSASNEPDGSADGRSRSTSGAEQSSLDIGPMSPDGQMSRRFLPTPRAQDSYERSNWKTVERAHRGEAQMTLTRYIRGQQRGLTVRAGESSEQSQGASARTSSAEDSPASPSPSPGSAEGRTTNDGSGPSSLGSFAYFDPDTSLWRMFQVSLLEEWATYSETWPRAGTTVSGTASRRQPSVPLISVTGSSSLPTPTESDALGGPGSSGRDGGPNLRTEVGGQLNPTWVEWLMGFPEGWTDLEGSVTPSSPRSLSGSGED
jgi:hypothetical protein